MVKKRLITIIILIVLLVLIAVFLINPKKEFTERQNFCTPDSRNAEVCTLEYQPVCGYFNQTIQCIKFPCADTYSNGCEACRDRKVEYWVEGECPA